MRPPPVMVLFAGAVAVVLLLSWTVVVGATTLTLERAVPQRARLEALLARDRARHARLLLGSSAGLADFPVEGSANPFTVGLYYTRVKLGNPPKEFYVQIDTGSDILWVSCNSCSGCPTTSGLNIELEFFDPSKSSTASQIACSDKRCTSAFQTNEASCSTSDSSSSPCSYQFQYGDGSATSGYYVSDTLYFDTVTVNDQTGNSSATVVFGCSNSQSGDLTKSDRAVDGIFGFGQQDLSIISQLSSQGVAPKVFSHCLKGSDNGGGILVLGEIVEPGIVYTPFVPSQPHYNLNLTSIAVNGQTLAIDPSVFLTSSNQGTIIDSGTTLAYLAEQAYDPFVNAITASISSTVASVDSRGGNQCYLTPNSINDIFPSVTLTFEGGASMTLKPQDYLLQQGYIENANLWCIGWQKNQGQEVTILGDLVLKDKIIVYDLANQRMGWTNYDCSSPVNVTAPSDKNEFINTSETTFSTSSSHSVYIKQLATSIAVLLVHVLLYTILQL